ncbi:MAG: N-6 DNA methylase [Thermodesulfovibrionales bacterium]
MTEIPAEIFELIKRFEDNKEAYRSGQYNETQLRREFIDPFFGILGWDVDNKQGYAEAYKDVIHEDAIKIGSAVKAPDYCFRIGGTRKFFVETKKPSVNIKEDINPAFQLRRYAWSAKLPLSILTDFEEFAVYDCRIKPVKTDKASASRIFYLTYDEYIRRWNDINSIFSRKAVLKGSFDKYAETSRHKKGTAEVDSAFLKEIESWRDIFARNIALRNLITQRELNFSVQRIIDRIVFLRICEDRGIEDYGRLMALLNGSNTYRRLLEIFRYADERYNSGLFHFQKEKDRPELPDELTPMLTIDDKLLKDIIRRLYYPESPYEFSVLPADILGQVYEQFLGKVIRLTSEHRAVVEEKPEVRKAGGVYYTPTYIVDYIVKNTVGKLLEGTMPKQVNKFHILDPACGSGSFLLGAYQHLLDWHRDWYVNSDPKKWATGKYPALYQAQGGDWHLTTTEKKRILLNNIYGVDIDSQAVEVTKLSLLLKVLEGENNQTLERQFKFFHERALPDLGNNIKCGNSLIGPDFYEQQTILDEDERYRINVFDWNAEFPEIMKSGGFDAVIGNPPYIQSRSELISEAEKGYYYKQFKTSEYQLNTYGLFIEKGLCILKKGGLLGMIVPNYWLSTDYDKKLRQLVFVDCTTIELVNVYKVFLNATVDTLLLMVQNPSKNIFPKEVIVKGIDRTLNSIEERLSAISAQKWSYQERYAINNPEDDVKISFTKNLDLKGPNSLKNYFVFKKGMQPYEEGKGTPPQTRSMMDNKIYDSKNQVDSSYKQLLRARNIRRYFLEWQGDWIKYGKNLAASRTPALFEGPRILLQRIVSGNRLYGTFTNLPYICNTDVITLKPLSIENTSPHILFFLGIILSKTCACYLKGNNVNLDRKAFPKINMNTLETFPIPDTDFSNSLDKARHDRMVSLVEQMLSLNKHLLTAKTDHEKTSLQRQIDVTDRQIDLLVYELYELTEDEIRIVEGKV